RNQSPCKKHLPKQLILKHQRSQSKKRRDWHQEGLLKFFERDYCIRVLSKCRPQNISIFATDLTFYRLGCTSIILMLKDYVLLDYKIGNSTSMVHPSSGVAAV